MQNFLNNIISGIGINDIIDILVVAFVFYKVIRFIKQSRAEQLIKGLIVIVVAAGLSGILHLYTLNWILKGTLTVGVVALIVVFQPELRRGLESLGRTKFFRGTFSQIDKDNAKVLIKEFIEAITYLAKTRTGALIIIERETALIDICETGTRVDAAISTELLGNIFYEGAPLHDGAVIIRGTRVHSAGCVLPLTQNKSLPKELGTRHRAGIGITENSDAISLIVSEETGVISTARDGQLTRYLDTPALEKLLSSIYIDEESNDLLSGVKAAAKKIGGGKDATK